MIRFAADAKGRGLIIGVGLSRGNCERLLQGHPIAFDMKEMGGTGELVIMGGDTEADMYDQLRKAGLIGPDTKVRDDSKLTEYEHSKVKGHEH